MHGLRIGLLQWTIGTFCAVVGALMLVSPHQFSQSASAALRPHLPWWGTFCLAGGIGPRLAARAAEGSPGRDGRLPHQAFKPVELRSILNTFLER